MTQIKHRISDILNWLFIDNDENRIIVQSLDKKIFAVDLKTFKKESITSVSYSINHAKKFSKNKYLIRNDDDATILLLDLYNLRIENLNAFKNFENKAPSSIELYSRFGINFSRKNILDNPTFRLFDYCNDKVLWSSDTDSITFYGDKIISYENHVFKRFNLKTGKLLWESNTSDLSSVNCHAYSKYLAVYANIMAVSIDNDCLIGIDADSGQIKWNITKFNVLRYQLDENDGKLKGLVSNSYFEIDVVTGDKKRFNLISHEEYIKNEMKTYDGPAIDSYRDNFVIVGDHIITTDSKSGLFGAFNTKTLKFDWWHEEPNVYFPAARPIRYFDSLLFLLDHKDTLHIYKIEDFSL